MSKALARDSSLALTGAEYVREKIIALAGLGPNSLYDEVYAIKVRVKSLESLVAKVKDKRKEKPYEPSDATDIVGMRLLCLYAEDLPNVTKALVRFIRFCQKSEVSLIEGGNLDDAIKEIKVYKSSRNVRVYDTVYRYCRNLSDLTSSTGRPSKVELIEHDGEEKSYSSIHFVCNAISHASGEAKTVPIEIQVRTVFEDTWGEIDHGLEYKMQQKLKRPLKKELKPVHRSYRELLNQLKGHLEDAGALAETIRGGYNHLYQAAGRDATPQQHWTIRRIFWGHEFEKSMSAKDAKSLKGVDEYSTVLASIQKLRTKVMAEIKGRDQADKLMSDLETLIDEIDNSISKLTVDTAEKSDTTYPDLHYFLRMEKAICYLWQSQIISAFQPTSVDETLNVLESATDIYFQLEKNRRFTSDAMLNFRLGCTMQEMGMPEAGEFFLNRSLENMNDDESIRDSIFQALIPHYFGFAVWKKRAALLSLGIKSKNPRINADDQKDIVLDALYFSRTAMLNILSIQKVPSKIKKDLLAQISNNLISYVWEIFDLSYTPGEALSDIEGVAEDIEEQFPSYTRLDFESIAKPMLSKTVTEKDSGYHDSLMKYHHIRGDSKKVELHKETTRDLMVKEKLQRKEGLNELYWYAQDRISSEIPSEVAKRIVF